MARTVFAVSEHRNDELVNTMRDLIHMKNKGSIYSYSLLYCNCIFHCEWNKESHSGSTGRNIMWLRI